MPGKQVLKKHLQLNEANHHTAEAIVILDKNGIIEYASPSVYHLLGYQPEEIEGTKGASLLYNGSLKKWKSVDSELQQQPMLLTEALLQFRRKDSEKIALHVHAISLYNDWGDNPVLIELRYTPAELITDAHRPLLVEQILKLKMDAREKMKQEIAAELHDHVNPTLVAVKLVVEYSLKNSNKSFTELEKIPEIINNLIHDVRNLSHTVATKSPQDFAVYESLIFLFEHFRRSKKLRLVFKYDRKLDKLMLYNQKIHLFRILQEQVQNIVKHANATKTLISAQYVNGKVIVTTRDNGIGFETSSPRSGIGLSNMLYRVNALAGNMHISSEPGKGTLMQIQFPID